jgi:ketosteroid isomerase-like protein
MKTVLLATALALFVLVPGLRPLDPDHILGIGHSEYTAIAEEGSKSPGIDDYQVVWHKGGDGVWRYVTDIFNSR